MTHDNHVNYSYQQKYFYRLQHIETRRITLEIPEMIYSQCGILPLLVVINACFINEVPSPYPPGWIKAHSLLNDFPVREIAGKNVTVVDPWLYMDRLGIFKIMVFATEKYFYHWGFNNTGNLLWGLPLQFGWQMTTGRLNVTNSNCSSRRLSIVSRFSPTSWWADMNYYLSIIPFLGALNAGVVTTGKNPLHILQPSNVSNELRDKFCTSLLECMSRYPELMKRWTDFFYYLHEINESTDREMDATITRLWAAHTTSIYTASPLFLDERALLSIPEMHFGRGWALLVDFIAATHFQTNLNNTHDQQILALPPRILHEDDHPPDIPDFTKHQNAALVIINAIYEAEEMTNGSFLYLWRKAMCSPKGRADGRQMLESLLQHPLIVVEDLVKLIIDFIKNHSC